MNLVPFTGLVDSLPRGPQDRTAEGGTPRKRKRITTSVSVETAQEILESLLTEYENIRMLAMAMCARFGGEQKSRERMLWRIKLGEVAWVRDDTFDMLWVLR